MRKPFHLAIALAAACRFVSACGSSTSQQQEPSEETSVDAAAPQLEADAQPTPPSVDAASVQTADATATMDSTTSDKPFCLSENFRISAKDGITDLPALGQRIPPDGSNSNAPKGVVEVGAIDSAKLKLKINYNVYVPPQYATAMPGTVGLMIFSPVYDDPLVKRNFDRLIFGGEMPAVIVVFPSMDWATASNASGDNIRSRANFLADELFPALKITYPKLSTEARMHGVSGQSTAGALAFDFGWARPDFFGKVSGDSTSFANFMNWLFPYDLNIDASHKDQMRVTNTVGEFDIGDWLVTNKRVATTLLQKGYATRLLVIPKGSHSPGFWLSATLDNMRWLWRTEVCR
jgi:enterochelin esterase-like enzyme